MNRKIGAMFLASSLLVTSYSVVHNIVNFNLSKPINFDNPIPKELLNLSDDGKILYGFRPGVTIPQIEQQMYNILVIPEDVEEIADYAFAELFDGISCNVSELVLNKKLKKIGSYAFHRCFSLERINWDDIQSDKGGQLEIIGQQAFENCEKLTGNLSIPDTVKSIGNYAFNQCTGISGKLTIPSSVEEVGFLAFANCTGLSDLDLSSYERIPDWLYSPNQIFYLSSSLSLSTQKTIYLNLVNNTLDEWAEVVFIRQQMDNTKPFVLHRENIIPIEAYDIDNDGKLVGFKSGYDLKDYDIMEIPVTVNTVAKNAFYDEDADIGKIVDCHLQLSITHGLGFEENAFRKCSGIYGEINLQSAASLGTRCFADCVNISGHLRVGGTLPMKIDGFAFENCRNISFITIDQNIVDLGEGVFHNCSSVSKIDVSSFGDDLMPDDWKLDEEKEEKVKPFEGLSQIGMFVFSPEASQGTIDMWRSDFVNDVGMSQAAQDWLYQNETLNNMLFDEADYQTTQKNTLLRGLTQQAISEKRNKNCIAIPAATLEIGTNAFGSIFSNVGAISENHWNVQLNDGLKTINDHAFHDCDGITMLNKLPSTLLTIGNSAFTNCASLTEELVLPQRLEYIGDGAFYNCQKLWSNNLLVPSSIKYMGSLVFFQNQYISKITIPQIACEFHDNAFFGMEHLTEIDLTAYDHVPVEWQATWKSFNLSGTGKIIINESQNVQSWSDFLEAKGLDLASWTIERRT